MKDKVWVFMDNWKTGRRSQKLDQQMSGPYKIIAKEGHSFRLELPDSIRVHPIFPAEKLRKAATDPFPGQIVDPPP